jgi:hypothetical protein
MNTFQVVNYIGHNTDPYWLTNYCAVKISLRILQDNISTLSIVHQKCCVDGHNIDNLTFHTQQDAFYKFMLYLM